MMADLLTNEGGCEMYETEIWFLAMGTALLIGVLVVVLIRALFGHRKDLMGGSYQ